MDASDNRRAARVSISGEVIVEYGGRDMRMPAMDLSTHGLSVWAPIQATSVPLRVIMSIDGRPVSLRGRVARQFESDGGAVWGIEFEQDDNVDSLEIVDRYVQALAS